MKIQQISSATFSQPNAWVATVMSATAIGRLKSTHFYINKIIKIIVLNGFVSFFI